jgi:hypothetical protein
MSANPFFSGRIPQDLYESVERHCSETGSSKTQVLINALVSYLDHPIKSNAIDLSVNTKLIELEKQISSLSSLASEVAELRYMVKDKLTEADNNRDNSFDNAVEQISIPNLDNKLNNTPDNNRGSSFTSDVEEPEARENQAEYLPVGEWQNLGRMHSQEILEFEEFKQSSDLDKKKLKQRLSDAGRARNKGQSVLIEPYFCKVVREADSKRNLVYDVYRRIPSF